MFESKGHVLNLHSFKWPVDLINNTITHNMAFIPSAITANAQKLNQSVIDISMSDTIDDEIILFESSHLSNSVNLKIHLLNYFNPKEHSLVLDLF